MLTIFSTPKPFEGHIGVIQHNALQSWMHLDPGVEVFVIGQEPGINQAVREAGARHLHPVERNKHGTPLINSIFALARRESAHDLLCYVNADVMFLQDLLPAVQRASRAFDRFLMVGRRWDLEVTERLDFQGDWQRELRKRLKAAGSLHQPVGSDYFIFPRGLFDDMPPFALGRAGWDNWMLYAARHKRIPLIDATDAITVVHQNHDYAHLPGGQPHYRLPESGENVRMAGGREAMFTLRDADWQLDAGEGPPTRLRSSDLRRAVEANLIAFVGVGVIAKWVRILMHPIDAIQYYSRALRKRMAK